MFAGHIGAALAIGRAERRVNIGVFAFAAMWLDFVLWVFVLAGWESATIPPNFASTHQVQFVFPYSHGLLASIVWSVLAAGVTFAWLRRHTSWRVRAALLVGAAVFSHWLLDALVHVPEMPLVGADSAKVGLGLWQSMPVAMAVEGMIVAVGLWLFLPGAGLPPARMLGLLALCVVVFLLTIAGMTMAPAPPSVTAMAASSLATIVAVSAVAGWLGRFRNGK
jgi:hypothetical protein